MFEVGIAKTDVENLENDVEKILDHIQYLPTRDKILLKPNIVVSEPPENGAITHPKVTGALVRYFRKMGREVVIAEGTGIYSTDEDFERLLRATRYDLLRDQLGVPIINLEKAERRKVPWKYGFIRLPKMLEEYEYINIPTMKTHGHTFVTLGVKNQKGLLPMETKKVFHKKDLHSYIFELSEVIQPTLTVVDAIYCIEGSGPTGPPLGEVVKMDLLVAGKDMMAVDNVCVQIMSFDIKEIKHLRPVKDIKVIGERVKDIQVKFKRPMGSHRRRHNHFVVHMHEKACTMCTVSFYKAMSKILYTPELHQQLMSRKDLGEINIIMGPADPPSQLGTSALCLGDCSTKTARKRGLPQIRGCHPDYREIINYLFPGYYSGINKPI